MLIAKDFLNEGLERLGWPQIEDVESPTLQTRHRKFLRISNRVLKALCTYNDWPLLRKTGTIVTIASEVSDTTAGLEEYVTATINSDTITVDNKIFTDVYIGRAILISGDDYVYRIISIPTPSTLQLNRAWISASIVPADQRTFTIAMDQYALPEDFDRFSDKAQSAFAPWTINPLDPREFAAKRRQERQILLDEPQFFTVWGLNDNETAQLLHFHAYPKFARLLTYDYQRIHPDLTSNQDKVLFPQTAIQIAIDAVLEIANRDLEAADAKVEQVVMSLMRNYNHQQNALGPTGNKIEFRPRNEIRSSFRQARMFSNAKIDWGTFWDIAEEKLN